MKKKIAELAKLFNINKQLLQTAFANKEDLYTIIAYEKNMTRHEIKRACHAVMYKGFNPFLKKG